MRVKNIVLAATLLAATALISCAHPSYYGYRIAPPPPPRYGVVGYAPGPGYVWADGWYDLRGGRWTWVPGYWVRPPRPRAVWVRPYWEPRGRGYYYHRGYWR